MADLKQRMIANSIQEQDYDSFMKAVQFSALDCQPNASGQTGSQAYGLRVNVRSFQTFSMLGFDYSNR